MMFELYCPSADRYFQAVIEQSADGKLVAEIPSLGIRIVQTGSMTELLHVTQEAVEKRFEMMRGS